MQLMHFVEDLGVQVIGGCCGTTPAHIGALSELAADLTPAERPSRGLKASAEVRASLNYEPAAASIYGVTPYHQDNSFLIIGERLNASGSRKVRELLAEEDWDGLVSVARGQVKENAHVLDVNVDYVGRDGESDMHELVSRLVTNVNLPLMLDSTEWQKMEAGLKVAGGKCILNSTNYEDGDERFFKVLELARRFGAGVVVGTIDEDGMARTAEKKFAIAQSAPTEMLWNSESQPTRFFTTRWLCRFQRASKRTGSTVAPRWMPIRMIRENLPGVHVVLGVSNVSFGLSPAARSPLTRCFCTTAVKRAWMRPSSAPPRSFPW